MTHSPHSPSDDSRETAEGAMSRRTFVGLSSAGAALSAAGAAAFGAQGKRRETAGAETVDTALGRRALDVDGAPVAVARMDPEQSYAGIGELLQQHIDTGSEEAWHRITAKIDYTYEQIDRALGPLAAETDLRRRLERELAAGRKLLFKPNLVVVTCIDPYTHGPGAGRTTCTEWPLVAALMRWFHDRLDVTYHQMSVGEAATTIAAFAAGYSRIHPQGRTVTPEAAIEGRCADLAGGGTDFYAGWGFYFARRYLAERHPATHRDDPMQGYEESVNGIYLPPGRVSDKLMVIDLNRIYDDLTKGRDVVVPEGANFSSITLHKAIVGGDPADAGDRRDYPGCVLVNVPKLKVHAIALFTNVIKNLGIGLYPMQAAAVGSNQWKYSWPHRPLPGIKGGIPHQVWEGEIDPGTGAVKKDADGHYAVRKTAGMPGTMVDIIQAVASQDVLMLHVVDAIEAINLDHTGPGTVVPEGLVVAGLDPVATDLFCARYMFSNVPQAEAERVGLEDGHGGFFPQRVPRARLQGQSIVTEEGYDCPLARDVTFRYAEARGLGQRTYHVIGSDAADGAALASVRGRLGAVRDGSFADVVTDTLYFDLSKMPWDLQLTAFSYFEAVDRLTQGKAKETFLAAYDEDGDGVVTYEEFGRKGQMTPVLFLGGVSISAFGADPLASAESAASARAGFASSSALLRWARPEWNPQRHDLYRELALGADALAAWTLSQLETEQPDPFHPTLTFGAGKWPSLQTASLARLTMTLYGPEFPARPGLPSLYGTAFLHADVAQNGSTYRGDVPSGPDPDGVERYVKDVKAGRVEPLDFVLYVPPGLGRVNGHKLPNVEETSDPERILTAVFAGGKEVWPGGRAM